MRDFPYDHHRITAPKGEQPAYMSWIFTGMGGVLMFGLVAYAAA